MLIGIKVRGSYGNCKGGEEDHIHAVIDPPKKFTRDVIESTKMVCDIPNILHGFPKESKVCLSKYCSRKSLETLPKPLEIPSID